MSLEKYKGIIPAFYACYDKDGEVSAEGTKQLVEFLIEKGVKGLYVGGSSGECIYLTVEERKKTLEAVMEEKQYELWFEGCRFHDVIRWGNTGKLDLDKVFNQSKIHQEVPTVKDAFFTKGESEHRLYVEYSSVPEGGVFQKGRHEYFPFPLDVTKMNDNLVSYGAWATTSAE